MATKNNYIQLILLFSLNEYPHLAGFQYAKDIALPNYSSAKIADRVIRRQKYLFDTLKKLPNMKDMIKPRLEALIHLKESLDNEFNLYSFMPHMYPFYHYNKGRLFNIKSYKHKQFYIYN